MSTAELDDLKSAWQSLHKKLERQHALTFHQIKETKRARLRSGLRPLATGQIIQIISGALLAVCGGSFWVDHLGVGHLMIYGIAVHLYGIMLIVFAARDLLIIKQFDYAAPVLELQKQIARLHNWHLRAGLWFGVTGCFIWIPILLMIFHGLGADVWQRNPRVVGWFLASALFSLGVLYAIVAGARRPGREKFAKILAENCVGRSVKRARAVLDEIERFERE